MRNGGCAKKRSRPCAKKRSRPCCTNKPRRLNKMKFLKQNERKPFEIKTKKYLRSLTNEGVVVFGQNLLDLNPVDQNKWDEQDQWAIRFVDQENKRRFRLYKKQQEKDDIERNQLYIKTLDDTIAVMKAYLK